MYAQHANTARPNNARAQNAAARSLNVDPGTYRVVEREPGRGYGRSQGYGGPRPYAGQDAGRPLFRIY